MDLIDDDSPGDSPSPNTPEFSVSDLSGALKRVIEGEFGQVRVRGEVSRVSRPASGHLYFDLKDDRAVLAAIVWKMQAVRLAQRPEEGMEVVATGRLTTYPGQSKYQMIVDNIAPAGIGALMAMLEKRRAKLAAEGLFEVARKRPLPFLPGVIGVITSPSGAVIRDILHRLRDRFPRRVIVWPVAVQGANCAAEVARAIAGFNALPVGGPIPRPDVLIVARGGGSIEDLWGFNEDIVVRAAAASAIPLISAVGHETDTTLIDHAADIRAPTPTAAAELAVPVRLDLIAATAALGARLARAAAQGVAQRRQRVADLARALPRPEALTGQARQRLDAVEARLPLALAMLVARRRAALARLTPSPALIRARAAEARRRLDGLSARLSAALPRVLRAERQRLAPVAARLTPMVMQARFGRLADQVAALERLRITLGYEATLGRGYAVVRGDGQVVTTLAMARAAIALDIQFADGHLSLAPRAPRKTPRGTPPEQGSLL